MQALQCQEDEVVSKGPSLWPLTSPLTLDTFGSFMIK
jgi:hypothetical protein